MWTPRRTEYRRAAVHDAVADGGDRARQLGCQRVADARQRLTMAFDV